MNLNESICNDFSLQNELDETYKKILTLPIGKRLHICARFGLGNKILAHSLTNVKMTSIHKMKNFTWNFSMFG